MKTLNDDQLREWKQGLDSLGWRHGLANELADILGSRSKQSINTWRTYLSDFRRGARRGLNAVLLDEQVLRRVAEKLDDEVTAQHLSDLYANVTAPESIQSAARHLLPGFEDYGALPVGDGFLPPAACGGSWSLDGWKPLQSPPGSPPSVGAIVESTATALELGARSVGFVVPEGMGRSTLIRAVRTGLEERGVACVDHDSTDPTALRVCPRVHAARVFHAGHRVLYAAANEEQVPRFGGARVLQRFGGFDIPWALTFLKHLSAVASAHWMREVSLVPLTAWLTASPAAIAVAGDPTGLGLLARATKRDPDLAECGAGIIEREALERAARALSAAGQNSEARLLRTVGRSALDACATSLLERSPAASPSLQTLRCAATVAAAAGLPPESVAEIDSALADGGLLREATEGIESDPPSALDGALGRACSRDPEAVARVVVDIGRPGPLLSWADASGSVDPALSVLADLDPATSCLAIEATTALLASSARGHPGLVKAAFTRLAGWWCLAPAKGAGQRTDRISGHAPLALLARVAGDRTRELADVDLRSAVLGAGLTPAMRTYAVALGLRPPEESAAVVLEVLTAPALTTEIITPGPWRILAGELWGPLLQGAGFSTDDLRLWWRHAARPALDARGLAGWRVRAGTAEGFDAGWIIAVSGDVDGWWKAVWDRKREGDDDWPRAMACGIAHVLGRGGAADRERLGSKLGALRSATVRRRVGAELIDRLRTHDDSGDLKPSTLLSRILSEILLPEAVEELYEALRKEAPDRLPWSAFLGGELATSRIIADACEAAPNVERRTLESYGAISLHQPPALPDAASRSPAEELFVSIVQGGSPASRGALSRAGVHPYSFLALRSLIADDSDDARWERLRLAAELPSEFRVHVLRRVDPHGDEAALWRAVAERCEREATSISVPPFEDPDRASQFLNMRRAEHLALALRYRMAASVASAGEGPDMGHALDVLERLDPLVDFDTGGWQPLHHSMGETLPLLGRAIAEDLSGVIDLVRALVTLPHVRKATLEWSSLWWAVHEVLGWDEALGILLEAEGRRRGAGQDYASSLIRFGPPDTLSRLLPHEPLHLSIARALVRMRGPAVARWCRETADAITRDSGDGELQAAATALVGHATSTAPAESLEWFRDRARELPSERRRDFAQGLVPHLAHGRARLHALELILD